MANLIGIDISSQTVRVAVLKVSYRKVGLVSLGQTSVSSHETWQEALRFLVLPVVTKGDSVAVSMSGDTLFVRRLELPPTAMRQLEEVLPFELESQLPFELENAVYDSLMLPRQGSEPIKILACVARQEQVRERIDLIHKSLGVEPERVESSSFALSNLTHVVPELKAPGPVAIVHLDDNTTDVAVLVQERVEFVRTLSVGTAGLPDSAQQLAMQIRQTLLGWRSQGGADLAAVYVTGPGLAFAGAEAYLTSQLGLEVTRLPVCRFETMAAPLVEEHGQYTRAIGVALGLARGATSVNLRRGALAYERGFSFLREKAPVLSAFGALIFFSFLFAWWMQMRALSQQRLVLEDALALVTQQVIGETIRDPRMAEDAINVAAAKFEDPMPTVDGFDIMVELSKAVPAEVKHDVEELDFQKGKASIHGIVESIPDAQQIASTLGQVKCFDNVKIVRTNQVVNENRQKYVLEFDVKCRADEKKSEKIANQEEKQGEEQKEP